jgi:hypothetical protein
MYYLPCGLGFRFMTTCFHVCGRSIRNFCFLHRSFSQHSSTKPVKATEILMVIATPSFIWWFTWPLSQMPVWVQAISM